MLKLSDLTRRQRGFTLAEMAIVVVIAGILVTMGLKMTMANLTNAAYSSTVSKQAQIKIALINYLRTNGKLPCPDMTLVPGPPNGLAKPGGCTGAANLAYGVLPWQTLGISRDTAIDGWGNFFVYKVQNSNVGPAYDWTTKVGATAFNIGQLKTPALAITVQLRDPITGVSPLTGLAVVVILSGGNNGYGMRTQQGQLNAAVPATNFDETKNANAAGNIFIVGPYSDILGAGGGPFDDVVSFMVPQDLLQPLVAEQFIASCSTYCKPCTGVNAPWPGCAGPNLPPVPPSPCTVAAPVAIPIGNPTPTCP